MASHGNQILAPTMLERALTAWDADYILNDEGDCFLHQRLAGDG
jgi:hypothetical protein